MWFSDRSSHYMVIAFKNPCSRIYCIQQVWSISKRPHTIADQRHAGTRVVEFPLPVARQGWYYVKICRMGTSCSHVKKKDLAPSYKMGGGLKLLRLPQQPCHQMIQNCTSTSTASLMVANKVPLDLLNSKYQIWTISLNAIRKRSVRIWFVLVHVHELIFCSRTYWW